MPDGTYAPCDCSVPPPDAGMGPLPPLCIPGMMPLCGCPGGGTGYQTCTSDGAYTPCDCSRDGGIDEDAGVPEDDAGASDDDAGRPDAGVVPPSCATACMVFEATSCTDEFSLDECIADCEQEQRTMARHCNAPFDALLSCIGGSSPTCSPDTGFPETGCDALEMTYANCGVVELPPDEPEVGEMPATWTELGPGVCADSAGLSRVSAAVPNGIDGAVAVVLPHPTNALILYVGAINGGVWRTANANDPSPTWTPLTDRAASTSIGAMAFDVADMSRRTILVGFGRASSFGSGLGGRLAGLLLSRDGMTFTPLRSPLTGANVRSVAMNGMTILAGTGGTVPRTEEAGFTLPDEELTPAVPALFRSTDGGANFVRVRTLPVGSVRRLLVDPGDSNRVYLALLGTNAGVFRSDDFGENWTRISGGSLTPDAAVENIELAIHTSATATALWVATTRKLPMGGPSGTRVHTIARALDAHDSMAAATWETMTLPSTDEPGLFSDTTCSTTADCAAAMLSSQFTCRFGLCGAEARDAALGGTRMGIHPGGQGGNDLSLAADPTSPHLVYIGGDRAPNPNTGGLSFGAIAYTGTIFRGDIREMGPAQWTPMTDDFADPDGPGVGEPGTAPHADSRTMAFSADGALLLGCDGGLYRRSAPRTSTGVWTTPMTDSFGITESHDAAWDGNNSVALVGTQDNGVCLESATGGRRFTALVGGDGGDVEVDDSSPMETIYYYSSQKLSGFRRTTRAADGTMTTVFPALRIPATGRTLTSTGMPPFVAPIVINRQFPSYLLFVTSFGVFESADRGATLTQVPVEGVTLAGDPCRPIYGGRRGGMDADGVIYAGGGDRSSATAARPGWLVVRTGNGEPLRAAAGYAGAKVMGITVDPEDWHRVWVADDFGRVWASTDAGETFTDVTGNLDTRDLHGMAFVPATGTTRGMVLVGGIDGVYAMRTDMSGVWRQFGLGLPSARVYDVRFHAASDSLIIGTLGRGAWRLTAARRAAGEFDSM